MMSNSTNILIIKNILLDECGFRQAGRLEATGSARIVKSLPDGSRIHVKDIYSTHITYDIDLDDPKQGGHFIDHAKSAIDWVIKGRPDKTKKIKIKKFLKKRCEFQFVKEYEKDFERFYDPGGFWDWKRRLSLWQKIKKFFTRK